MVCLFNYDLLNISGHLDPGETDMQAAIRETQEEAGLMKDQLNILEKFKAELNYNVRGKPKTVTYWLSELKDPNSPVTLSHEHIDFKWLRYKEALEIANYSDMQNALKEAFDFLTENEK